MLHTFHTCILIVHGNLPFMLKEISKILHPNNEVGHVVGAPVA